MSVKLIVVVEDKAEEQERALAVIRTALQSPESGEDTYMEIIPGHPQVGLKLGKALVLFSSNLANARSRMEFVAKAAKVGPSGVITDLMFPREKGGKDEPNGLPVIVACIGTGVPVVVCSDTDHHDIGYLKEVFPVLGKAHPKGEIPVILDKKDWDRAVGELLRLMDEAPAEAE